ncbi:hypothetical protein BDV96DRAFT_639238 [Lophiotrema nucula]|uniref:Basic proline-rich protein n=1 Tax=Lophiotrema nucula TaxID=690887 RepID=A0A6A5ZUB2_9PLEO|nr:hypothetical protein BDV96DRAFT_639238 [Lophiotrema nucula]
MTPQLPSHPAPPSAPADQQTSDLVQRLKALSTANAVPEDSSSAMGGMNGLSRQLSNSSEVSEEGSISHHRRPSTPRSQTDPSSDQLPTHHPRPRNRSPYSRSHLRSSSGSASLSAPPMTRAHSLPAVINSAGHLALSPSPLPLARASSPLRSPKRTRSPFRTAEDSYSHSGAPSVCDISEDAELELTPRAGGTPIIQSSPLSNFHSGTSAFTRGNKRRPASPLYQVSVPFGTATSAPAVRTPTSTPSSPLLSATKYNESFPGLHYSSSVTSSSIPSTPTSMRSRSPSISSLETIEDTPDAEAEALEADRIAQLKAAADRESESGEGQRRSSLDVPGGSGRAFGFGKRDSRKRWSVCGAERRGDLDLETIWED